MAAGRSSRPKANMLSGLGNINGKARNFINTENMDIEEINTSINESEPIKEAPKEKPVKKAEEQPKQVVKEEAPIPEPIPAPTQAPILEVPSKPAKKPGRPRKYKEGEKTEVIGVRLLDSEVRFLEEYGGKFGGKTGYVTYLIREEMKRLNVND